MADYIPMPNMSNKRDGDSKKRAVSGLQDNNDHIARIEKLEKTCQQLSLLTETLWEIIAEQNELQEPVLLEKVTATLALRAERADERLHCSKCNMSNTTSKAKCIYCGGELVGDVSNSPFRHL
ncbi:hypothetical protein [Teredinibacter waterburyi]|jgi:hypothetical protein|uniref:hypothetical protein n=1 Tax=Teredinibacter waterburyi TaxID=1500538 RepID=UPI00165EDEA9|nr:hypothetical protein [Teredinibacter waterburyi]